MLRGEFIWDGKYDAYGNRNSVDPVACAVPLSVAERLDCPRLAAAAAGQVSMFASATSRVDDARNRLLWGDNKTILASLLPEFRGRIDLIYIDPPFDVGTDFAMAQTIGEDDQSPELEVVAYRDSWGRGGASYLQMMFERLTLMRELLSDQGSIFVHCDWRVNMHLRCILDEVFGKERFRNQIAWCYTAPGRNTERFKPCHDSILYYSKGPNPIWTNPQQPLAEATLKVKSLQFKGQKEAWTRTRDTKDMVDWWEIPFHTGSGERLGYPTQKPEALIERILDAASLPGSLVADFFCGSGTLGAAAERMGRRWILADVGRAAISTTRKRLIGLQRELGEQSRPYRAFDLWTASPGEAMRWFEQRFAGDVAGYQQHILRAAGVEVGAVSHEVCHGDLGNAACHVLLPDVACDEAALAHIARTCGRQKVYVFAFEWPAGSNAAAVQASALTGTQIVLVPIPREVIDDGRSVLPLWCELPRAEARLVHNPDGSMDVALDGYESLPLHAADPTREPAFAAERGIGAVDCWAIDFDWHAGTPFTHDWQDFRTRRDRSLQLVSTAGFRPDQKATGQAAIRVWDVYGTMTTVLLDWPTSK
jgi:DNA modification methylase